MSDREKRERWVREAIAITDAITKNGAGRFLCPLCLEWFTDPDELSLDHAPPESVGGRHIAVTCRDCNSRAGHSIDHELRNVETLVEFGEQRMTGPMRATFGIGDAEQRGEATMGPDGLKLVGVPAQNDPAAIEAVKEALETAAGSPDAEIRLSFRTPDFRKASIAWLRAGYLAAFALLGYLYILNDELDPVREQIANPDAEILTTRCCVMTGTARSDRLISLVEEPPEMTSVLVLASKAAVILPSAAHPGIYERLEGMDPWPPGEQSFSGKTAAWPTEPAYRLDRWKLSALDEDAD